MAMKRILAALLGVAMLVLALQSTALSSDDNGDVLRFDTMVGVTAPFTGDTNAIRGVPGGGLPWQIAEAKGRLRADGRLDVRVEGLVLARRAPVPDRKS